MTTDKGSSRSDVELRAAVLDGWHRLVTSDQSGTDKLATLASRTGISFRQLDMARRVRNQIAHPDEPVPRERLLAAFQTIMEAEQRLDSRRRPKPGIADRPVSRDRVIGYRRLTLRPPAPRPASQHKQDTELARRAKQPRAEPRHLEFHVTSSERSTPKLIPLTELGLSPHAATVTCDVPWLNCAIVGDSVRLIAEARTASRQRGSARISSRGRSVTITVDVHVSGPPEQTSSTRPTIHREVVWTGARVASVALAFGVLLFLAIIVA